MVTQSPRDQKWEGTDLWFCLYRQDIDAYSELTGKAAQSCMNPCEHRGYVCGDAGRGWACGSLCVVLLEASSWHDGTPGLAWACVDPWQGPASLSCPKEQQKSRRSQW